MPRYYPIKEMKNQDRRRTLSGLGRLREQLEDEMPVKTRDTTLILGTWNIRNFDDNRFVNGVRTDEDLFYIAEIISRFDIVAIQEVCDSLKPLDRLMWLLGANYDYVMTDVTEGRGGNGERLGFIFDRDKVAFQGIAGELVLPDSMQIKDGERKRQFARTPFMCSFQSGWFKFMFSTVHIYFGSSSGSKYRRRVKEIEKIAKFLAKRAKTDDQNHVLVGDFNIVEPGSEGSNALENNGFEVFQNKDGSNKDQTKFYDQISFRVKEGELKFAESGREKGVLQIFKNIYREDDFDGYKASLKSAVNEKIKKFELEIAEDEASRTQTNSAKRKQKLSKSIAKNKANIVEWRAKSADDAKLKSYYLNDWRTFHGSDHLPLWVELEIDFSDAYLAKLAAD